jgi:putative redox protein
MSTKTATVALEGDGMRFRATVGGGQSIFVESGAHRDAMSPAELVPVALAGCTAMDVISILRKKRQPVTAYEVRVVGEQREDPQPAIFTSVEVLHVVDGDPELDPEAVRRSIELSATKYCAVSATIASGAATVRHAYLVRRPGLPDATAEVIVEGPYAELEQRAPAGASA